MNLETLLMNADFLVSFPGLGIRDLPVSRVAFEVMGYAVYWYGLLIALAIIVCLTLAARKAPDYKLKSDDILDTFILIIPMMIIFARLYYVAFAWEFYSDNWRRIIDINHGGLAFYGGVIGGMAAIIIIASVKKIKIGYLLDYLAVYVPLGQAIGRWGNFFNQEAFGTNTQLPWGMYSNQTAAYLARIGGHDPASPVHPTFFYEFVGNLIIFMVLLRIRKNNKTPFRLTLYYFLLYGFLRFFVEWIRTDPLYIGGTQIRVSMLLSAVMVVCSLIILIILNKRRQNQEMAAALADDSSGPYESNHLPEADTSESPDLESEHGRAFIPLDDDVDSDADNDAEADNDAGDDAEADNDADDEADDADAGDDKTTEDQDLTSSDQHSGEKNKR